VTEPSCERRFPSADALVGPNASLHRCGSPAEAATSFEVGGLTLDRLSRKVERDGEGILLQPREFRLLEYLMKNAGKVVTRTMLLENVWDYHFDPQTNVIDVHMSRLRSKIDKGHATPLLHFVHQSNHLLIINHQRSLVGHKYFERSNTFLFHKVNDFFAGLLIEVCNGHMKTIVANGITIGTVAPCMVSVV
jgi:hypothetical protein